jgi:hypothetical protein
MVNKRWGLQLSWYDMIWYGMHAVLRIRICMFLGLADPDPIIRGTDPDPSIIKQNILRKTLIPAVL